MRVLLRAGPPRWAALVLVIVLLGLAGARPARAQERFDPVAVDRFVRDRLAAARLPGMALAVTRGTETVLLRGYGHDLRGDRITPDTPFRLASVSKSFTALAVLQLAESGRIGLDDPVRRYLPGFRLADGAGARITVRQLLHQTSGLGDRGFPGVARDRPSGLARRVADLRDAHPVSAPGSRFQYTDLNYQVLGRMVEAVTGRGLADRLRRAVFAPLGMDGAVAVATAQAGPGAAPGLAAGGVLVYGFPVGRPELRGLLAGSGGVIAAARDMADWLVFQNGDGSFAGRRLLSPAGMSTMHTPPPGVNGDYAMGWFATSPDRLWHNGILSTSYADQVLVPDDDIGVALLYPVHNAATDYDGIREGVIALAKGWRPPDGRIPSGRVLAIALGLLTLGTVVLRTRALLRSRRWADRARARSRPRTLALSVPALLWPLLPAAPLAALPWLTAHFTGRVFGRVQLFRALPAVQIWLLAAGVLGIALSAARLTLLLRRR